MSATTAQTYSDVSIENPKSGKIKFFNSEPTKRFGFIETADYDVFFSPKGYRKIQGIGDGRIVVKTAECPVDALENNLPVLVLGVDAGRKGLYAYEWTIPSLNSDEVTIYSVVQRIERITEKEHTSEPVCDNERRMFKTHTTRRIDTFVNEHIVYSTTDRGQAEKFMADNDRVYRRGLESTKGTRVSHRIESTRLN